jgi:hypothetical protein
MASIVAVAVMALLAMLAIINARAVAHLRAELRLVEERQNRRWNRLARVHDSKAPARLESPAQQ